MNVGVWTADAATTLRVPEDHPTIQAAIQAAKPGDVIDVAPGTYPGAITIDRSVTIVGRDHDPADPRNNTTILDGGGATVVTVVRGSVPARSSASRSGTGTTASPRGARSRSSTATSPAARTTWTSPDRAVASS
jgi:pectin methylesterase-like acyl-CoA thioesterase